MIKINLFTGKNISNTPVDGPIATTDKNMANQGGLRVLVMMLGPIALFVYQNNFLLPEKTAKLAQTQKAYNELLSKNTQAISAVEETKKFAADETKLKQQIGTIDNLRKDRMREVKVLDLVQKELPERMWLTKVEFRSGKIGILGMAGADSDLTQFMDSLSKSGFLSDVNLIKTSEKAIDNLTVKEFSIECAFPKLENKAGGAG